MADQRTAGAAIQGIICLATQGAGIICQIEIWIEGTLEVWTGVNCGYNWGVNKCELVWSEGAIEVWTGEN